MENKIVSKEALKEIQTILDKEGFMTKEVNQLINIDETEIYRELTFKLSRDNETYIK